MADKKISELNDAATPVDTDLLEVAQPAETPKSRKLTFAALRDWILSFAQAALGFTPLHPDNNLSDVADTETARQNLGAQTALPYTPLFGYYNLGDVDNAADARANLGAQAELGFTPLNPENNLSEVTDASVACENLGAMRGVNNLGDVTDMALSREHIGAKADDGVKEYIALLSAGSPPTAVVLKNTLGGVPTLSALGNGATLTLTNKFPVNKTIGFVGCSAFGGAGGNDESSSMLYQVSASRLDVIAMDAMNGMPVFIYVYP